MVVAQNEFEALVVGITENLELDKRLVMASKDRQTTLSAQVKLQALSTKGQFW